jgi:nucleoid-associated protein YgaU
MQQDADTVDAPDPGTPDAGDDFVAAPKPKPQPKPLKVTPPPPPAPAKPPAPTLADLADTAPKAMQQMVLEQAGLDTDTLQNMSDDQIADAFKQVVAQSGKPGTHSITVHYDKIETFDAGGEDGGTQITHNDATAQLSFTSKSKGDINGMKLDPAAFAATEKSVHLFDSQTVSDTLTAMGFANSVGLDDPSMRDLLATAMFAARTPGAHEVSFSQRVSVSDGGDGGGSHQELRTDSLSFNSDKKGVITVDGKPLPTANTIAMSETLESVPTDQQRNELIGAGFPSDKVNTITPEEVHRAMTHVSVELARPGGVKPFEVALGGDDYNVNPKNDANGKLQSLEISEKPKSKSRWKKFTDSLKKIAGPVLTVLSFIPVTAPFAIAANAALSVVNGIKNHNPLGVIAGLAGGVASFAGDIASSIGDVAQSTVASAAQTVANVANTASAGLAAIKGKNPASILGFIAGAAGNLASSVADTSQDLADSLRDVSSTARTAAQVASGVQAIRNHDVGGILSAASGALSGPSRPSSSSGGFDQTVTAPQPAVTDSPTNDGPDVPFENGYPDEGSASIGQPDDFSSDESTQPSIAPVSDASGDSTSDDPVVTVQKGDTLSDLAQRYLGDARLASVLYAYNQDTLGPNPNLLRVGDEIALPPPDFQISAAQDRAFWSSAQLPSAPGDEQVPVDSTDSDDAAAATPATPPTIDRRQMYDLGKDFDKVLLGMTAAGHRIDAPGWVNNLYGVDQMAVYSVLPPLMRIADPSPVGDLEAKQIENLQPVDGCHGQAIEMSSVFNTTLKKSYPGWSFTPVSNYPDDESPLVKYAPGSGYHWVIQATSPEGHQYMLDPNNGTMDAWTSKYAAWQYKEGDDSSARNAQRQEGLNRLNTTTQFGP